jgi:phosphatidylserine/phosphatidylglycerophosphate/cardiolipin synthase-like enzyme
VITSGNLTAGGLIRNFECGVSIEDGPKCAALGSQIENYSRLGAKILEQQIVECCTIARELKKLIKKNISTTCYSPEAMTKIEAIDEILITRRLAGRPVHGIFSETILYLLRQNGEMSTSSLHNLIEQIHPDLCDNRVDRVIDGKRFGKKWKHAVRTSQQHLKKNEEIHLNGQNWAISE